MEKQNAVISAYISEKGFGFLTRGTGKEFQKFFFHIRNFKSGLPIVGTAVSFDVCPIQEGPCPSALNVELIPVEAPTEPIAAPVDPSPLKKDEKAGV